MIDRFFSVFSEVLSKSMWLPLNKYNHNNQKKKEANFLVNKRYQDSIISCRIFCDKDI